MIENRHSMIFMGGGDMGLQMAPCGLLCDDCDLYRAAFSEEAAATLVSWFKARGWIGRDDGVTEVMAKAPFCYGCYGDRSVQWSDDCEIRACCVDRKELPHCAQCPEFSCKSLLDWAHNGELHALALKRLEGK